MADRYDDIGDQVQSPAYFAHVVLRTSNLKPMVDFYKTFLGAHATYENERLSFITYDEEHHRIAIVEVASTSPKDSASCGLGMSNPLSSTNLRNFVR